MGSGSSKDSSADDVIITNFNTLVNTLIKNEGGDDNRNQVEEFSNLLRQERKEHGLLPDLASDVLVFLMVTIFLLGLGLVYNQTRHIDRELSTLRNKVEKRAETQEYRTWVRLIYWELHRNRQIR